MWPNPQFTLTEEIFNGKLHFLCSVHWRQPANFQIIKFYKIFLRYDQGSGFFLGPF